MTIFPMTVLRYHWHTRGQPRPLFAIAQAIRTHQGLATWTARVAAEHDKKRRDKLKKHLLPAIIITGTFDYRSHQPSYEVNHVEHKNNHVLNGLYAYDLDGRDRQAPQAAQADLLHSPLTPHVALTYTSPSGRGLRFAVHGPVAKDVEEYADTWDAMSVVIEHHMAWKDTYGLTSDLQSRVACMPYMLAHDVFCYVNLVAEPLTPPPLPKPPPRQPPRRPRSNGQRTTIATAAEVHDALSDLSYGPNAGGWYATTDFICHGGSSDKALSFRTDDDGMLHTKCFGSANCDSTTIRHALQGATGLVLCICPDCRKERRR